MGAIAVDDETSFGVLLASDTVGSGPVIEVPGGLAIETKPRKLLVCDGGSQPRLFAVDLTGGTRRIAFDVAGDPTFPSVPVVDVGWLPRRSVALVLLGGGLEALVALDVASGQRVIVSR